MRALARSVCAVTVGLLSANCDGPHKSSALTPTPVVVTPGTAPRPADAPQVIRVLSGLDNQPVINATVTVDETLYGTNGNGEFRPGPYDDPFALGSLVDIKASGFIPRRTRIEHDGTITLWPVANDAEADAVHRMVYQRELPEEIFYPPAAGNFTLTLIGATSAQRDAWDAEAAKFGAQFHIAYDLADTLQYEANELEVRFLGGPCVAIPALGFCQENSPYKIFDVMPEKALDRLTIDRVLASWFLGTDPLTGLLNATSPAAQLSPFEVRTIQMMFVRRHPTRWPDDDSEP